MQPIVKKIFIEEVKGWKNIPKTNFILATNHQSHLDIIVCGYLCVPRSFTYIGQIDRYTGLSGFLRDFAYLIGGVIPINREDDASKKTAIEKAIQALKKGYILVIYPEGTRSRTGEIQKGKLGVAKIFFKTGAPILPVGIKGTFDLMPAGKNFPKIKKSIKINIGGPLYFKEEFERAKNLNCDSEEYKNLQQKITDEFMREIVNLSGQTS